MPIQIDGKTPDTIRIGRTDGSLATVGEARVWDDGRWKTVYESWKPRTVSINTTATGWDSYSASGDTSLISSLESGVLLLEEDAICDTDVRADVSSARAGDRISAGVRIQPSLPVRFGQTYTFTSVRA